MQQLVRRGAPLVTGNSKQTTLEMIQSLRNSISSASPVSPNFRLLSQHLNTHYSNIQNVQLFSRTLEEFDDRIQRTRVDQNPRLIPFVDSYLILLQHVLGESPRESRNSTESILSNCHRHLKDATDLISKEIRQDTQRLIDNMNAVNLPLTEGNPSTVLSAPQTLSLLPSVLAGLKPSEKEKVTLATLVTLLGLINQSQSGRYSIPKNLFSEYLSKFLGDATDQSKIKLFEALMEYLAKMCVDLKKHPNDSYWQPIIEDLSMALKNLNSDIIEIYRRNPNCFNFRLQPGVASNSPFDFLLCLLGFYSSTADDQKSTQYTNRLNTLMRPLTDDWKTLFPNHGTRTIKYPHSFLYPGATFMYTTLGDEITPEQFQFKPNIHSLTKHSWFELVCSTLFPHSVVTEMPSSPFNSIPSFIPSLLGNLIPHKYILDTLLNYTPKSIRERVLSLKNNVYPSLVDWIFEYLKLNSSSECNPTDPYVSDCFLNATRINATNHELKHAISSDMPFRKRLSTLANALHISKLAQTIGNAFGLTPKTIRLGIAIPMYVILQHIIKALIKEIEATDLVKNSAQHPALKKVIGILPGCVVHLIAKEKGLLAFLLTYAALKLAQSYLSKPRNFSDFLEQVTRLNAMAFRQNPTPRTYAAPANPS
jgi:hypothetical protein